jgi:hypothetical protein
MIFLQLWELYTSPPGKRLTRRVLPGLRRRRRPRSGVGPPFGPKASGALALSQNRVGEHRKLAPLRSL